MNDATRRSLVIFILTGVAGFWINAAAHTWMLCRRNPLVRRYKATLQFRSALVGDTLLLPAVNVLLDRQLADWGHDDYSARLRRGYLAGAVVGGVAGTAAFHLFQGWRKLTNWTMPRPWRWNAMGYYHAVYMAGQITALAYFCIAAAARVRHQGPRAVLTGRLLAVVALLGAFAALLYKDYY